MTEHEVRVRDGHGETRQRVETDVYCAACNTWLEVEGDDPATELFEHEGELHD